MTLSTAVSPVFFRTVADRKGAPGALLLDAPDLLDPEFIGRTAALSGQIPCLFPASHPDAPALGGAGWRALPAAALCRVDDKLSAELVAPEAQWIDGDWCLAAPVKPTGAQAASRTLALQLVERVARDADTHEIEALLRQDPALSYQLLKVVNSLGAGAGRRITSFAQALMILGRQQLRRWLNLMLFAARDGDVRSGMLLARVAMRARALELLAKEHGCDKLTQEQAFMTGMFSLLGALFGMPLAEVLAPLSLGDAVQAALLDHAGELGDLLALIELAERGDHAGVAARLAALDLDPAAFNKVMLDATGWMLGAIKGSREGGRG